MKKDDWTTINFILDWSCAIMLIAIVMWLVISAF